MRSYYKILGLENQESVKKIYKEILAINGVEEVIINAQKQEMTICADEEKLPRIEHAAIVILSYITPQISIQKI